jgi:formylmethanofuran dehydrogenase subunit D
MLKNDLFAVVERHPEKYTSMGWQIGEKLIVQVENGEMRIFSQAQAIAQAQEWVASFMPVGRSLSEELMAERRSQIQNRDRFFNSQFSIL